MSVNYEGYVSVFGEAFRHIVDEAVEKGAASEFETGYLMGLHRAVTLMQQTAEAYEIPADVLGVADLDEAKLVQ
jgi:hypothetical protein